MKRIVAALVTVMLAALAGGAAAQAQEPASDEAVPLCVSVLGTEPVGGWDLDALLEALDAGTASLVDVADAASCVPAEPVETLPPAGEVPLAVEVVDAGFSVIDGTAHYAVIVRNPNPSGWKAEYMSARLDFLTGGGELVTTYDDNFTLLPGQTGALVGSVSDAKGSTALEVFVSNGEDDWDNSYEEPGDLTFSQVKTKAGDYNVTTTGRIASTFADQMENVEISVVYRDKAGDIVGGAMDYVDFIPAGGTSSFKASSYGDLPKVTDTEVYYGL